MKKQIMSIAAAAALFTTGAMAFDYTYNGEIVADITKASLTSANGVQGTFASYVRGVDASETLKLSTNSKGDALIYPAFKAGEGWSSNLVVRNSKNNATVCKVVLYAADNSRELLDFDIYLSPYDVFRFDIAEDGTVSTNDGSFALVDPTLATDKHRFVKHNGEKQVIGKINARTENANVVSGYAVIYGMVEATNSKILKDKSSASALDANGKGAYHNNHSALLTDFRAIADICRDVDDNISTSPASWRTELGSNSATVKNGTATGNKVVAPNVSSSCLETAINDRVDNNATLNKIVAMKSTFTSPSSDLLFGDVTISTEGEDPRNLVLPATALENYTAPNQMMLWMPGEYAAIQDRRITDDINDDDGRDQSGYSLYTRGGYSDYNLTGIEEDSYTFVTNVAYYTFDKNEMKGANTLLITQPTKRALIMALKGKYWITATTGISPILNKWGEFTNSSSYFDENEKQDVASTELAVVISPVSGDPDAAYKNELQVINDPERTETASEVFAVSGDNGFAIMNLGTNGLPSIVTQMTGSVVGGESQINWVYSTTK